MKYKILLTLQLLLFVGIASATPKNAHSKFANSAPVFLKSGTQSLTICQNSGASALDSFMVVSDADLNQILTWSLVTSPTKGTLHGFPGSSSTNGSTVSPTGFDYTPNTNATGSDSFSIKVSDGIASSTIKIKVTINASPAIASIVGPTATCIGNSVSYTNATSGGQWSSSNTFVAIIDPNTGQVTTVGSGQATIIYSVSNTNGCASSATLTLSVYSAPIVNAITTSPTTVNGTCTGSTLQLYNTTTGGVWKSLNTNVATIDSATGLVYGVNGTGNNGTADTITYTVKNAGGCSTSVNRIIYIYGRPNVTGVTVNNNNLCVGNTTTASPQGFGNFTATWSTASGNNNVITVTANGGGGGGNATVAGIAAGTDSVKYTAVNQRGCSTTVAAFVRVNALPVVGAITGTNGNLCVGLTDTLFNSTSGGTWSSSSTSVATIGASSGIVTGVAAGNVTFTYRVTNNGCAASATTSITVTTSPTLSAISGSNNVCLGSTTTLINSQAGGVWSSSNTAIAVINSAGVVTPLSIGLDTISYTYTNAGGCSSTVTFPISVVASIVATPIVGPPNLCLGSSNKYTSTVSGGTWRSSSSSLPVSQRILIVATTTGVVTAAKTGTDTLFYVVGNGTCKDSTFKVITVYAVPSVSSIVGPTSVCVGLSSQLTSSPAGGVWASSNTPVATVDSTGLLTGVAVGNAIITYTVTNSGGCSDKKSLNIAVNAIPTVSPITGLNNICVGFTTTYANATAGGVWGIDLTKSTNPNAAFIGTSSGTLTALDTGTVCVTYQVSNSTSGCFKTEYYYVSINNTLKVSPIQGNNEVCVNSSITLTDSTLNGSWSSANPSVATVSTAGVVTGKATGTTTISYFVDNGGGCSNTVTKQIQVVTPITLPAIRPTTVNVCTGDTTTVTNTVSGGIWTVSGNAGGGGGFGPVASIDSFSGVITGLRSGNGTITYTYTSSAGCVSTATRSVTVNTGGNLNTNITPGNSTNYVCTGSTLQLSNATAGGTWISSNESYATVSDNGLVTGISPTSGVNTVTITYSVQSSQNCPQVARKTLTVTQSPTVNPIVGNVSAICAKQTTTLTNSTTGGVWSSKDTSVASISTSGVVTGKKGGTTDLLYTVSSTTTGGFPPSSQTCSSSASYKLQIYSLPTKPTLLGTTTICNKQNTQLFSSIAGGNWVSADTSVVKVNASSGVITSVGAGAAYVYYIQTTSNGCSDTASLLVTVNPTPTLKPIVIANSSQCQGTTTQLSNTTAGGVWSSSNTSVATVNTTGLLTAVNQGTSTIGYKVTNQFSCSDSVGVLVTVNPKPSVGAIAGSSSVCVNKSLQYTDTTLGGIWKSSNTSVASVDSLNGNIAANAQGLTTISYTVSNGFGCTTVVTKSLTVNALPVISPIAGNSQVCQNATSALTSSPSGGTWVAVDNSIATINSSGVVTGKSVGSTQIKYIVTTSSGCVDSVSSNIAVNPIPSVNPITASGNAVCVNSNLQLNNSTANGTWASSVNANATVTSTGLVSGLKSGTTTITYSVQNNFGCTGSSSFNVTVNPLPSFGTVSGKTTLCVNETSNLTQTPTGGTWSTTSNNNVISLNGNTITALAAGNTTVTYSATTSNGCSDSVTYNVLVNSLPTVAAITGNTSICVGNSSTLQSTTKQGVWTSSNSSIAKIDTNGVVNGVAAGNAVITYTVTNSNGCSNSVNQNVAINSLPTVSNIVTNNVIAICAQKSTTYSNNTAGGVWGSSNTNVATIDTLGKITAVSAGTTTISYFVTNQFGCTNSATQVLTVNAIPVISAITGNTKVCFKSTTQLSSTPSGGSWKTIDTSIGTINATSGLFTAKAPGNTTVRYTVTNSSGCTDSLSTTVTVNALPTISTITGNTSVCVNSTTQLSSSTTGGTWKSTNTAVATVNASGVVTGISAGAATVRYVVTNSNGCTDSVATSITSNALPTVANITGATNLCIGTASQLTNATSGGVWSSVNTAIATIDNNGNVTPVSEGKDTIVYTVVSIAGCTTSVTKSVVVNSIPMVATNPSVSTAVSMGDTIKITAVATVLNPTYSWTGPNGFTATTASVSIPNATNINAGNYIVVASNNGCLSQPDTLNVVVNMLYAVSGSAKTPLGKVIKNFTVSTVGTNAKATVADASGNYSFMLGGSNSYQIVASKNNDVSRTNGVNAIDAALMQSHILQKSILNSPYKIIAADVNSDNRVTALDIVFVKRLILGIDTIFPKQKFWTFVDSSYTFPSSTNPFSPRYRDTITINTLNAASSANNFIGVKLGDVNFDWNANLSKVNPAGQQNALQLYHDEINVNADNMVYIPVKSNNFKAIMGSQFTIKFNQEVFDFVDVKSKALNFDFGTQQTNQGNVSAVWIDENSTERTLNSDDVLFTLVLRKKAEFNTEQIRVTSDVTTKGAFGDDLVMRDITLASGSINNKYLYAINTNEAVKLTVAPNPSNGQIALSFSNPVSGKTSFVVTNVEGKQVYQKETSFENATKFINLNVNETRSITAGTYFLTIINKQIKQTTTLVIK